MIDKLKFFYSNITQMPEKFTTKKTSKNTVYRMLVYILVICSNTFLSNASDSKKYIIDENSSYYVNPETWDEAPSGGDTVFISSKRTKPLRFQFIEGNAINPVVVINYGGQVKIDGPNTWGAITFENCRYIKITGTGDSNYRYGFDLAAKDCGLAFCELSSDCEAGNIKIDHEGFFGIMAKKDYGGNPPSPAPVFSNLIIHDCLILNVTEGMYLGETKSPGMEFKHVRVFDNIVKNTGRESIQIANMTEDIEIYNNTLLNAGRDGEDQQNNILQIGDNSVAKVYNNIMMDAPGCGIISFGMGNNFYTNNYIASCKGIFLDDRKFTDEKSPILIADNYFVQNKDMGWIIRNMNQFNYLTIADNVWDSDINFYKNDSRNDSNFVLNNNTPKAIEQIKFIDPETNNFALAENNPIEYSSLGAKGGPEYLGNAVNDDKNTPEPLQIILSPNMLIDEVSGGSLYSADYLVDEQVLTPENQGHPVSQSWKPFWNMTNGPYHVIIDLGEVYQLTTIALHDMHNTQNLEISVGVPGKWEPLFTENCDKYKTWKEHEINVSSRYIRLSMNESVYAAINEIVLFGYSKDMAKSTKVASDVLTDVEIENGISDDLCLVQNPVQNKLMLNLPNNQADEFKIEIFNLSGIRVFSKNYLDSFASKLMIDISGHCTKNGMYILRYSSSSGIKESLKFLKKNL